MESENPQHHGGIYNYFQGATINHIVINGNMSRSGNDTYYREKQKEEIDYSDEQVARALTNIVGKGKPVDSKQKWAAVYWYLRWQCNFPVKGSDFCERIASLPFTEKLDPECDYNNIRKQLTLPLMSQDARNLDSVRPTKFEEETFAQYRTVVLALEKELGTKKTIE